jgi:2-polyprenyl-3-methyl-5-hydroxy-6-metoxy-1,4-benzoquinol methylase
VQCILCGSFHTRIVSQTSIKNIQKRWLQKYEINIDNELDDRQYLTLYECLYCNLQFYPPELAGSEKLYEQLQKYPWYYMPEKWEYYATKKLIKPGDKVLEVGCGIGDFLSDLITGMSLDIIGIEYNEAAVMKAQEILRPVYLKSVQDLIKTHENSFDVVCGFQVLEHVSNPQSFIAEAISLLKPGGYLIFGVPNSQGFIKFDKDDLLNQPPHHITRWSEQCFRKFPVIFPLKLQKVLFEPLAAYHLDWYVSLQLGRIFGGTFLRGLIRKPILYFLKSTGWYHYLNGHTMLVCFERTNTS